MGCIWKRGSVWWIKYRRHGRSHYESARTKDHGEAKKLLAKREAAIADGVPVTPKIGQLRYDDAIEGLINHHKLKGRPTGKIEQRIAKHLTPVFQKRRLSDLTLSDFEAYAVRRQAQGAANGTVNRELSWLQRAYNLAKRAGKLLHVPAFPALSEANPRTGFFENDQIANVISHLPDHLKPVVRFGYITGWRASEILKLEWRQVDMKAGEVRLDPGTTKNRDGRVFTFTSQLREMFDALHREHQTRRRQGTVLPWVFVQPKKAVRVRGLRGPWATACKRAGLPGRLFHDLRRSAARNFVRAGIPERTAMDLLGHKTRSIFDRYNIVNDGDRRDAARRLDAVTTIVTIAGDNQAK